MSDETILRYRSQGNGRIATSSYESCQGFGGTVENSMTLGVIARFVSAR